VGQHRKGPCRGRHHSPHHAADPKSDHTEHFFPYEIASNNWWALLPTESASVEGLYTQSCEWEIKCVTSLWGRVLIGTKSHLTWLCYYCCVSPNFSSTYICINSNIISFSFFLRRNWQIQKHRTTQKNRTASWQWTHWYVFCTAIILVKWLW
jgi:hypothetical protein